MNKNTFLSILIIFILIISGFASNNNATASSRSGATSTILYVKTSPTGLEDCSNWADACELQNALNMSENGDQIWVAAGIYLAGDTPVSTFQLKDGVEIYGGFPDMGGIWDDRDWVTHITTLSGDIGQDDITDPNGVVTDTVNIVGINAYHVVTGSGVSPTAVLDGFIITAGYASLTPPNIHGYGGGMFNWTGSPTLNNLIFSGNTAGKGAAYYGGGGMFNIYSSNPVLNNITLIANTAGGGGGMYNGSSAPILNNVTFSDNESIDGSCMVNYVDSSPLLDNVSFYNNTSSNKGCLDNHINSNPILTNVTFSANSAMYGAAIYNYQSSPELTGVVFSNNMAGHVGGAMENEDQSNPILNDVLFIGNTAIWGGGGIYNGGSAPILNNVTFSDNEAVEGSCMINYEGSSPVLDEVSFTDNTSSNKGCMLNHINSNPTLTNVTFSGNSAMYGAAIYNYQSSPELIDVVFVNNAAGHVGGAMHNEDNSNPVLNDVLFLGNTAIHEGGGIFNGPDCDPTIMNGAFISNTVTGDGGGGGVKIYNSSPTLTNVTFSGNHALVGGGIDTWQSSLTLTNVTFSDNTAEWYGAAIFSQESMPTIINTIVWGNTPIDSQMLGISNVTYSIIYDGFPGMGNLDVDPKLKELADNGGFSPTYALQFGSPAIDSGSPSICPAMDQRGMLRPIDGDGNGLAVCDIGSYEQQITYISPEHISISGPSEAMLNSMTIFTATVEPITTTLPLTYTWQIDDQLPITHTGELTDTVSLAWEMPGTYVITVSANNLASEVTASHAITITTPIFDIYLPLLLKPDG